jgi:uncharacterized protein YqeY
MTLEFLQNDMKQAMKIGDTELRDIMRSAIGAIKKMAIDKRCEITEELINDVLIKEAKILQEQIDTCPIERQDTANEYKSKLAKLKIYLPRIMNDPEEIRAIVIGELAAAGIEPVKSNKGITMKTLMPIFKKLNADMKIVNQVITEELV